MSSFEHDTRDLAETYDRVSDQQLEGGRRLVERLALEPGARVLDIGCGTGRLARWVAQRVGPSGAVVGIDPLPERVELARAHAAPNLRFERGQAEDLALFDDARFDAVTLSAVLHWVVDKERAFAEVRRVLRPGGRVGATTVPQELSTAGTVAHALMPLFARAPYAGAIDLSALTFARGGLSSTDVIALVQASGLELVELHVTQRTRVHADGAALVDFLQASSFGNFLRIVPDELRDAFRADLIAALDARSGPDGVTLRDWVLLFVAARPA